MYKTLVLSLKTDTHRREHITKVLDELNLPFEFFDALTPDDITDDLRDNLFKNIDIYDWDINHDAVLATFMSQLAIIKHSADTKTNILLLEDDLMYINEFNFDSVDFSDFDLWNLSEMMSCCAYFINHNFAEKLHNHIISSNITQAFDWELFKLRDTFNFKGVRHPIFIQTNKFVSNLAPNGYKTNKSN